MDNFDRYGQFKANGKFSIVPFVKINKKNTDKYVTFNKRTMRLDKLSYDYYKNPDFGWLIMQANPEYGSIENFIQDGVVLRIPFPLEETLNSYINSINSFRELNGYE
jgi:hypothetical protein